MIWGPTCDLPPVKVMAVAFFKEKVFLTLKATDLFKVLFDKVLKPLDVVDQLLKKKDVSFWLAIMS